MLRKSGSFCASATRLTEPENAGVFKQATNVSGFVNIYSRFSC